MAQLFYFTLYLVTSDLYFFALSLKKYSLAALHFQGDLLQLNYQKRQGEHSA